MDSLWGTERLQNVGWILSRYSDYVMQGDVIRRGIEGDPCNTYRGSDVPYGTVSRVEREDGHVLVDAPLDLGQAVVLRVEEAARAAQLEAALRARPPRHRAEPLEVRDEHRVLRV